MSTLIRPAATDESVERCARRRVRDARCRDSALEKDARDVGSRWSRARVGRSTARVVVCGRMMDGCPMGRSEGDARGAAGTKTSDDDCDID